MAETTMRALLPKVNAYLKEINGSCLPGWQAGEACQLHPLAQGEYNMNFLIQQAKNTWVLRINTGSQIGYTLNQQITYEYDTLKCLESSGVTPKAYYLDASLEVIPFGILVMQYLQGDKLDYTRDLERAATVFASYHQVLVPPQHHLIVEHNPLSLTYQRCLIMLDVYLNSPLADPTLRSYLLEVRHWADGYRQREVFYQQDPWHCIINTEVNNGNFIINRQTGENYLVDWEKPLLGDPSQDLSHFRVPTTTLWKTDYRMTDDDRKTMMKAYLARIQDPHLRDTMEERTALRDPMNCLRGISWCSMAWVTYRQKKHVLRNSDTFKKLSMYTDINFVRSLFDPLMKG